MTNDCAVYDDGVLRITNTDDPPGLAIAGEIDESTYDALVGALGKVAHGPAEVHVSLGGVSYCDLAGLRAIVCATGADRGGAGCNGEGDTRRVVLHEVPPQLATVLRIVGWDSTPGLAVDQPPGSPDPRAGGQPGSVAW
ncbi:MAG TPA: STAS domain-containing protein [Streptosporangiaceae bacterium]|nr:STAS domain-containing protein [Streptosporangiaceae bacterium]